jgi:uncharacterized protein YkwD
VSRPRYILSVIALVAAWTLVATSPASASDCGPTGTQVTGLSQPQMESSIACLINVQRASSGLQPVSPNGELRQAALGHSNEMISQSYFGHTSPGGVTFEDRIEATGYMHNARRWLVGENLVWGTGPLSTPQAVVTAWMNSPPHRENLLRPTFREIGIAAVPGTPQGRSDLTGVTVSSEYGYRAFGADKKAKAGSKKHKSSKAKARKARSHKKRHHHKKR